MSCEDDDYGWDPVIDVVTTEKLIDIKISTISKGDLEDIERTAISALEQKLTKLNVILKNLNIYCRNNIIFVNDRYGISKDLVEIVEAFGMDIRPVTCSLRGKSFVITDDLVSLIKTIDPAYEIRDISNFEPAEELMSIIDKYQEEVSDVGLSNILQEIKNTGAYMIQGRQSIISTYEDGRLIEKQEGEVVSEEREITKRLKHYLSRTSDSLQKVNRELRDGIAKLLHSRARQMGYSVKEERKDDQVQLVLVRCE